MMSRQLSYDELESKYRDLQLRVTKFSSIEQELINVRDQMDEELEVYKRINTFYAIAQKIDDVGDLVHLISESLLNIFEVEIGFCYFRNETKTHCFVEGVPASKKSDFDLELNNIRVSTEEGNLRSVSNYSSDHPDSFVNRYIISRKWIEKFNHELTIIAAVSNARSQNFKEFTDKLLSLMSVFLDTSESILSNVISSNRIKSQLNKIKKTELELSKLSLIATKSNSGVIICNSFGEVEWVNEFFSQHSGYTLEEVRGKKPKDFLRIGTKNSREVLGVLSFSLRNKKPVGVVIQNSKKNGELYYNKLDITPVFDTNGVCTNFIALQQDITADEKIKNDLKRLNRRFEVVTESNQIGIWEYDIESQNTTWNQVLYDFYGIEKERNIDLNAVWLESIHEDDVENLKEKQYAQIVHGYPKFITTQYRVKIKEREERYVVSSSIIEEIGHKRRLLGTIIDITKSKSDEMLLKDKNNELITANHELDQFVYSISHDLRAPLLSIRGIINLINEGVWQDNYKQYLDLISVSVDRLDQTILEMLDYSRNARVDNNDTSFDIENMVRKIFQDISHISTHAKLELQVSGSPVIISDELRVSILLKNLISNAVKYLRKDNLDSFVNVEVNHHESGCDIIVEDNGEGIAEENIEKIFDMFFRASETLSGSGLGLYICKQVIEKLKGTIKIESKINEGTKVMVSLPMV